MPKRFSLRRVLRKELDIFRRTGTTINLIVRSVPPSTTYSGPGYLLSADTEPTEVGSTTVVNIFGKFEEVDAQTMGATGRERLVRGVITVPMMYRKILAKTEYINPYNDGVSRFRKIGAIVDEGRLFVTQQIESVSLANVSQVV